MKETGRIRQGGLAIIDGLVDRFGPADEILRDYRDYPRTDASNKLVTPGLVDCHTHLVWAGERSDEFVRRCRGESYQEIAKSGGGILSTMRATRGASVEELVEGLVCRANEMLAAGTTAIEIKASYGLSLDGCRKELDAVAAAVPQIRQRIVTTFMGAHAFPPDYSREDFLNLIRNELIPMAAEHDARLAFNDVFCEDGAFSVEEAETILLAGIKHGLKPKIHSDEFRALGGTEMACALGAASCDHLLVSEKRQIDALANSGTIAVTMPGTAFYLNKPYADARKMVDAGCAVALGTDYNPGSSMVASMTFVFGLAVARMGLTPEEALTAATVNAVCALGGPGPHLEATGSLESGTPADFCVWPCASLDALAYRFSFIRPESVYIGGNRVA